MDKIGSKLQQIKTRGDFRGLSKRAEQGESRQSESDRGEIPSEHPIWDVWQAIREFYPLACANWDSEPPFQWYWQVTQAGLTDDQLRQGVANLVNFVDDKGNSNFPPNCAQFIDLCGASFDWEHSRQSVPAIEAMNAPIIDRSTGSRLLPGEVQETKEPEDHLAEMRAMMGISRNKV